MINRLKLNLKYTANKNYLLGRQKTKRSNAGSGFDKKKKKT